MCERMGDMKGKCKAMAGLLLLALLLLMGCGSDAQNKETESGTEIVLNTEDVSGTEETSEALPEQVNVYEHVLSQYRDMVQNDFYMELRDSDEYDSSFGEDIGLEIRLNKQDIYYALYDIDGNGAEELIIAAGVATPSFSTWNYDLYGYNGKKAVHLFPELEFGYRTNFSLFKNGVIEVFYSVSAAESGVDFYRIGADGLTPELTDSFVSVFEMEGEEPQVHYYQNRNEITEEEYNANIESREVPLTSELHWVQIQ